MKNMVAPYLSGLFGLSVIIYRYLRKILQTGSPCRVGSVGNVSASRTVGREFASRPGHTKDHHKNGTIASLHRHACVRVGVWQCSPTV